MKKISMAAIVVAALLGLAAVNGCRHERHPGAELMVDYLAEALDLTEAQREQADRIKNELIEKGRALRKNPFTAAGDLKRLLTADELDQERLKELLAAHHSRMEEMADLAIRRLAEFHRTLSPEQKAKLVAKMETFMKMHRARGGFGSEG